MPAGGAGLADGKLAAAGIEGKAAIVGEGVRAHELRAFALRAKAEILDLQHIDDWIVVVRLQEIEVGGADASLRIEVIAIERPTPAFLHRVLRERIQALH